MKRIPIVMLALSGAIALNTAFASTNDPTSPFYLLPTPDRGTTLHSAPPGNPVVGAPDSRRQPEGD